MKADYKNWMPKGMVIGTGCGMIASLVLFLITVSARCQNRSLKG